MSDDLPLYDDDNLFSAYQDMRSAPGRLNEVLERPAIWSLIPNPENLVIADLGCGAGDMVRDLCAKGARDVLGIDASERMIAEATRSSVHPRARFLVQPLETLELPENSYDLVVSSLALHYVEPYDKLVKNVWRALKPDARFVFSVEHPIVTCARREWQTDADGERAHWPVDHYSEEGSRLIRWLGLEVPRQHRTISTYLNVLIECGFVIEKVLEPVPDDDAISKWPRLADQRRRPPFLLVSARKM
ncbi:methylase involved in ubiquinone/menaquinone biosynthesis [Rhizobium leguminosarum bv. trifolii WSM2297]|uniref:Methylase involved in ubiquinone/menaquinone biosynthesis n=1 Tax=Rhizobium leguminosarum bv. trifolii WSM2297 TaxID=754762 RepID=J0W008_RHILT|nr:class I SAM-dependent methyltransferase [Rhizobium leguminosarum]EJC78443.1 methylase involved in ubiquinone/menaquinone biosynthesis [Rhizobium leguminosarum bv. trifolii WSM2297]